MIDMPTVPSGTYATGTITTAVTADAVAKSAEVPQTDGAITVSTTTPHRVGGSLLLTAEDIAAVGQANFQPILRDHLQLVLSDHLDNLIINGDTATDANEIEGLFKRLTDPSDPAADVETFDRFIAIATSGIDGLWASMLSHISLTVGVDTYKLAAQTFRDNTNDLGDISFADYGAAKLAGFWTNKRMPATASHVQQGVLCRKGRMGLRTAVMPTWGSMSIDDVYTGSRKGERAFTVHVLVGDLILVQPDAYAQVAFRVST